MSYKYKIKYNYDHGISIFTIYYKGNSFVGTAMCHDDDKDMESERTGLTIAEARAYIKMMRFIKKYEIKPKVDILYHLMNNIKLSKYHNPKAYEFRMIRNQYNYWNKKFEEIKTNINDEERYLKEYIDQKDKLYHKLRAKKQ